MKRTLPPLNGLRAFEAAARHMSFTDAAEELSVTQAAISHQVRGLEQRLGLKLFVRRNRSLLLSEAGQAYLPSVRAAFDQLNERPRSCCKDRGGHLTVTPHLLRHQVAGAAVGGFQRHPRSTYGSRRHRLDRFSREDVDIGIRYGRGSGPICSRSAWRRGHVPVCAPSLMKGPNPLKNRRTSRYTLLYRHLPRRLAGLLTAAGIRADATRGVTFDNRIVAYQAAIDGLGALTQPLVARSQGQAGWRRRSTSRCRPNSPTT
jgi:LysR family glycine cleavage system transcriptional activator